MNELTPPVSELDHHRGPLDAPSVLVQFGDYECPDSAAVHPLIQQLIAEAGDQICFVYRHFPLSDIHRNAEPAAEAVEAAHTQGRFWEMHDALYENSPALELPDLLSYARDLDLDEDRVRAEIRSHLYLARVQLNIESGLQTGVHATPTFFINGVHYRGSYDVESMLEALKVRTGDALS
jgi:protein-disulfide isomerase